MRSVPTIPLALLVTLLLAARASAVGAPAGEPGGRAAPDASAGGDATASARAAADRDTLSFEFPDSTTTAAGWRLITRDGASLDGSAAHGGRYALRLRRDASSQGEFSAAVRSIPATASGDSLELRGWLRTEDVSEGYAGLWLREDAGGGSVEFDNMADRGVRGTTPWTEYRIALPLDPRARRIAFGALLSGRGSLLADDLELRVDGVPLADAPPAVRAPKGIDADHEFDGGSGITTAALTPIQTENSALLVRVWGFVKYHDPRVASGAVHWDYELFRALPAVLAARTRADARRAIVSWLDRRGAPPPCDPCATPPESTQLAAPIAWIHDRKALGADLSARLETIHDRRDPNVEPYYAAFPNGRIPDFSGEAPFDTPVLPDPGYRLLAVARFWNIVEYWFPYRDVIPGGWDAALGEFLPRAVAASDADAYRRTMMALSARVGDGHATVGDPSHVRPPGGDCEVPVSLRPVAGRFLVEAYRDSILGVESGLRPGDALLAIDGASVDSIVAACAPYYSASNEAARRRSISFGLLRGPCGPCRLSVERDGRRVEVASRRDSSAALDASVGRTHVLPGEAFRLLAPDVAYLKLSAVEQRECASYVERAAGTRCFVVDIRGYPREFVPFELGGHFVTEETPFVRFTHAVPENPGAFVWQAPISIQPLAPHYDGALVILTDDASMSQAEYTAMALRAAPGAIVVGSTTAGADGNIMRIQLPGGVSTYISTLGVFTPDRRPTQRVGIVPDLESRVTPDAIRRGRDVVLEAALRKVLGRDVAVPTGR